MERQPPLHRYVLLVLAVLTHLLLFSFFGVRDQFVDSQRYMEMADYLIRHGRLEFFYQLFYAIPVILLASFRFLLGCDGQLGFVLFQSMLSVVATYAVYRSSAILFKDLNAGLVSAIIFLLWLDCMQWNTAVMTESLAASFTCFVIYWLVTFVGKGRQWLLLVAFMLVMITTRPTGVLIVVAAVAFMLCRYREVLNAQPLLQRSVYFFLAVAFLAGAWLMLNEWDFTDQYVKGNIVTYMDVIEGQPLYDGTLRLDTADIELPDPADPPARKIVFFIMDNPIHFLRAAVWKVFYVVSFYRPYFSTVHNVYTLLWLSIVYLLFFVGLWRLGNKPMRAFVLMLILTNCFLVALSAADWDNRFYMPMQPCIVLVAGGGGGLLLAAIRARRRGAKQGPVTRR